MALDRYLELRKLEILKKEVEFSTNIQLKTMPHQLINENRFKKKQEKRNKRRSAILIIVSNKIEAKQLLANGFCFGGAMKKLEKYWKADSGSV